LPGRPPRTNIGKARVRAPRDRLHEPSGDLRQIFVPKSRTSARSKIRSLCVESFAIVGVTILSASGFADRLMRPLTVMTLGISPVLLSCSVCPVSSKVNNRRGLAPRQVFVFAEDRDGIFLVRSLIQALNEAGWSAARGSSNSGVPDGLNVWPADETGRQVRDALANATGLPVNLIDSEFHKQQKLIAIGVGFKAD
jgi:hypothetical protein